MLTYQTELQQVQQTKDLCSVVYIENSQYSHVIFEELHNQNLKK